MQLIFDKNVADQLREKYTVVELETITIAGHGPVTSWCVLPAEKLITEFAMLPHNVKTHEDLLQAISQDKTNTVLELCETLKGCFGGELDSFYEEMEKRVKETGSTKLVLASN
jgi:hypothetical protein